jgi:DNA-directed RNA polymerase subunit RPC12/RpoP
MMKCPYCWEKKPSHKFHDVHPELLKYWDYDKNTEHGPEYYNEFSNEVVFWKCENGHSFKNYIFRYSQKGFYCIVCNNTQLVPDINDLQTMYPDIAAEFDNELNEKNPEDFKANSSESIWWKCPNGHSPYKRSIRERVLKGWGCSVCANTVVVAGVNDALSAYTRLSEIWDYKANNGKKPEEVFRGSTKAYDYVCNNGHHWSERLISVVNALYSCAYCSDRKALPGFNTLADRYPELAEQWDELDSHNEGYNPYGITTQIKAIFSWICTDCGNSFLSSIQSRISNETSCPYCAGKKALSGITSLKAIYPEIASEFSDENEFDSDMILPTYTKPVYWNCSSCEQQWWSSVIDRVSKKANCPFCNGRKAIRGKNSLKALYPQMADEIITEDNRDPDDILPTYAVNVQWNCTKCDQSWVSTVKERVSGEADCPYCAGRKSISGKTSFKAIHPEIAVEFSNKNEQDPDNILPTYSVSVLWNCKECGLEWSGTVKERVKGEAECPYCAGKKAIPGKTSFEVTRPDLMEEWIEIANWLIINPNYVLSDNQKLVWWKCKVCNRNYSMSVKTRVNYDFRRKIACPYCKGYRRTKHHFL